MRVIEVNKYNDFLALEEKWQDVLGRCSNHTVFSTWEWLTTWWKYFGNDRKLVLLLAEHDDRILGIAPMMYTVYRMFGLRRGKIEFISTEQADYNDFILTDKNEESIMLFLEYLNNLPEKWDCLDLIDIPQEANSLGQLRSVSKNLAKVHVCPYIRLPKSYDAFLRSLDYKKRKNLRRASRALEKDSRVDFVDCSGTQSFAEGMESFFELHQKRWESKGYPGVFGDQRLRRFHVDIARSFAEKGWLGLFLLRVFGRPVAAHYGFKYRSKFYSYLTGFDPRYSKYGVGSVLAAKIVANCIQDGLVEFDFLRGAEEYKERWNTTARWNQRAVIPRKGFLGQLKNLLYEEYWRQGKRIRYFLKIKQSV
jgi:CelD/BcsL family acetyltransferase involved in cellulose biosynthesis